MKLRVNSVRRLSSLIGSGLFTLALHAGICSGAVLTYTNDFSGTGGNTALPNQTNAAKWAVSSGTYNYTPTTTLAADSATLNLGNDLDGVSFTIETQFVLSSSTGVYNNNTSTIGFGIFGTDAAFSGGSSNPYVLADFAFAHSSGTEGTLRLLQIGSSNVSLGTDGLADINTSGTNNTVLAINPFTTYTLRLDAVYTGSAYNLTLGLYDVTGTTLFGTAATGTLSTALTGDYFGYRNRIGIGGGSSPIAFDNLSISNVPEPSSVALMALGLASLVVLKRRMKPKSTL